jgi:hypothetical protein
MSQLTQLCGVTCHKSGDDKSSSRKKITKTVQKPLEKPFIKTLPLPQTFPIHVEGEERTVNFRCSDGERAVTWHQACAAEAGGLQQ